MLVYTPNAQRLVPATPNVMCLCTKDDGYVYASKTTYDQAVILNNKYWNDVDGLAKLIGPIKHADEVERLRDVLPEPINILAGFLAIIEDKVNFNGTIEELVGCLHIMSMTVDFAKFVKVHPDIRADVSFSDHIRLEYELQWQQFVNESVPYDAIYQVFARDGTFAQAGTPVVNAPAPTGNYAVAAPAAETSAPTEAVPPGAYALPDGGYLTAEEMDKLRKIYGDEDIAECDEYDIQSLARMRGMGPFKTSESATEEVSEPEPAPTTAPEPVQAPEPIAEPEPEKSGLDEFEEWGFK